jgi:hypothetical protein
MLLKIIQNVTRDTKMKLTKFYSLIFTILILVSKRFCFVYLIKLSVKLLGLILFDFSNSKKVIHFLSNKVPEIRFLFHMAKIFPSFGKACIDRTLGVLIDGIGITW